MNQAQICKKHRRETWHHHRGALDAAGLELILNYSVLPEQAEQIGLPRDEWRRGGQTF